MLLAMCKIQESVDGCCFYNIMLPCLQTECVVFTEKGMENM